VKNEEHQFNAKKIKKKKEEGGKQWLSFKNNIRKLMVRHACLKLLSAIIFI
jgi:hypothetical protein